MNCKRCEVACPSGVKVADIIQSARRRFSREIPDLRDRLLASTDFMGRLARPVAPLANAVVSLGPVKGIMDVMMDIEKAKTFPKYQRKGFVHWFEKEARRSQGGYKKKIAFFHGCSVKARGHMFFYQS